MVLREKRVLNKSGPGKLSPWKILVRQIGPWQIGPLENVGGQIGPLDNVGGQIGPRQIRPRQIGPRQIELLENVAAAKWASGGSAPKVTNPVTQIQHDCWQIISNTIYTYEWNT